MCVCISLSVCLYIFMIHDKKNEHCWEKTTFFLITFYSHLNYTYFILNCLSQQKRNSYKWHSLTHTHKQKTNEKKKQFTHTEISTHCVWKWDSYRKKIFFDDFDDTDDGDGDSSFQFYWMPIAFRFSFSWCCCCCFFFILYAYFECMCIFYIQYSKVNFSTSTLHLERNYLCFHSLFSLWDLYGINRFLKHFVLFFFFSFFVVDSYTSFLSLFWLLFPFVSIFFLLIYVLVHTVSLYCFVFSFNLWLRFFWDF